MSDDSLKRWLDSAEYLPIPMRDFHAAKDLFKTIHDTTAVDKHQYAKSVDWVTGQCYVIDIFLWWMAKRGYTLQRTRKRIAFRDLSADLDAAREARNAHFATLISQAANDLTTTPTKER